MKIRVAIAVDDEAGFAYAVGSSNPEHRNGSRRLPEKAAKAAMTQLGFQTSRILWNETEIPDPPAPIQAVATTEDE